MRFFIRLVAFTALTLAVIYAEAGQEKLWAILLSAIFFILGFSATRKTVVVKQIQEYPVFFRERRAVGRGTEPTTPLTREQAISLIRRLREERPGEPKSARSN